MELAKYKTSKLCSASTEAAELRLGGGGSQPEALARGRSEAEATASLGLGYCCDGCGTANWPAKREGLIGLSQGELGGFDN